MCASMWLLPPWCLAGLARDAVEGGEHLLLRQYEAQRRLELALGAWSCAKQGGSDFGQLALRRLFCSQRQIVLQAAPSFGQPRPISRLGRAGTQAIRALVST